MHGGSLNLKNVFKHLKSFFVDNKKKGKKNNLQEPNEYAKTNYGFDHKKEMKKEKKEYREPPKQEYKREQPKEEYREPPKQEYHREEPKDEYIPRPGPQATAQDYATLGLTPNATHAEVKKAFRRLSLIHHPDKGGDPNKFHEISNAHDAIMGNINANNLTVSGVATLLNDTQIVTNNGATTIGLKLQNQN
eukprot:gene15355-20693_t